MVTKTKKELLLMVGNKQVAAYGELIVKHEITDLDSISLLSESYNQNANKYKIKNSFGGSECNVLIALSSLGIKTKYASALGNNQLSKKAFSFIKNQGIETKHIDKIGNKIGEYYFINNPSIKRENATKFYRNNTAINNWNIDNFDFDDFFNGVSIFHISGICLSLDDQRRGIAYKNALRFVGEAKKRNVDISFDFNFRPSIWNSIYNDSDLANKEFRKTILPILKYVDIFMLSNRDLCVFLNIDSSKPLNQTKKVFYKKFPNAKLLVIRNREKDKPEYNTVRCSIISKNDIYEQKGKTLFPVREQIGGGDAFDAGIIYGVLKYDYNNIDKTLDFATQLFALKHQIIGDYIDKINLDKIMKKTNESKTKTKILIAADDINNQAFINMKNNLSKYASVDLVNQNIKSLADYDIFVGKYLSSKLLKTANKLRAIFAYKTGVEEFPLNELKERGINIYNSHCNALIIAEYTIGLLMSLTQRISEFDKKMREGIWYDYANPYWCSIKDMKIGILGYGNIGKQINILLNKLEIKTYTIKRSNKKTYENINTVKNFDALVNECDVIISALPDTPDTRKIFNKKVFEKMKGKYLVNVGRGSVINEKDLFNALKNKDIAGAAIDTWENKAIHGSNKKVLPSKNVHFELLDNIILSPHQATKTKGWQENYINDTQRNIINYILGNEVDNKVNLTKGY